MIAALEALKAVQNTHDVKAEKPAFEALKISSGKQKGWKHLFATHPELEDRIQRLKEAAL
jgi:Zn-dependent protease with chaperone function